MSEAQNGGNVMERLTYRDKDGFPMMKKRGGFKQGGVERLAAYEDRGCAPEEVLPKDKADEIALKLMRFSDLENFCSYTRLRELAEADKDGRLVVLPCKVGDTVYFRTYDCNGTVDLGIQPHKVTAIVGHAIVRGRYTDVGLLPGQYGVSWFLTREEAEKASEAMKDE